MQNNLEENKGEDSHTMSPLVIKLFVIFQGLIKWTKGFFASCHRLEELEMKSCNTRYTLGDYQKDSRISKIILVHEKSRFVNRQASTCRRRLLLRGCHFALASFVIIVFF